MQRICFILILSFISLTGFTQQQHSFTKADSLRGGTGRGRSTWDVMHYEITVKPDYNNKSIAGAVAITYLDKGAQKMQIDLQAPLFIDSIICPDKNNNHKISFEREGNVYWVFAEPSKNPAESTKRLIIYYQGKPRIAVNPPWDGGWIFTKDAQGRPWMSAACQGTGASAWFPCKDAQDDEPNNGATLNIDVPDSLVAVGNGILDESSKQPKANAKLPEGWKRYTWKVINPINNYNIIPYIGKYICIHDSFQGEKGKLITDFWVLDYNKVKAEKQFRQVPGMLHAFEKWFGPYPFYEDSYKLVEAPYVGMEHQSAIAYGNKFENGYTGRDLSGTGIGLNWDFIIIHESGHEWFGNNITSKDIADLWIHESFTTYAEVLYIEETMGKAAADKYLIGCRKSIDNKFPCIGAYGVQDDPASRSSDVYAKGACLIHTIRQVVNNDKKFRKMLRSMNHSFYHKTVTTADIEQFIVEKTGIHHSIFDQYLRTITIPALEYSFDGKKIKYRWLNTINGFTMPIEIIAGNKHFKISPSQNFQEKIIKCKPTEHISINPNYYIDLKEVASQNRENGK